MKATTAEIENVLHLLAETPHHTIFTQARRMAHHEMTHCEQIEALALKP